MVLEAFACSVFSLTEFTKSQHFKLAENTREKILDEGLYHFTSKEVADRIISDGYFRPTKGIIRNHFGKDKVYMFAGLPDMKNFSKNLPADINPFVSGNLEFSTVRVNPNEEELSKFKERMQDSAIVYEGRYDIANGRGKAIELVVDLNEEGKCIFREKTEKEIEDGYVPSKQLLDYINEHKIGKRANDLKVLYQEIKQGLSSIPKSIPRFYNDFKDRSEKKKAIKEFEPYEFCLDVLKGENQARYNVKGDKLEFYGDKKLTKVRIDKEIQNTGETKSYECYLDEHILNLGNEASAIYLSKLEDAIESKQLNKVNDIYYAGSPMLDIETNDIVIGVDARFNELLKERNLANELGEIRENSYNIFNKKVKDYYRRHPIKNIMNKIGIKKGNTKMLSDRNEIGKYTNERLQNFSFESISNDRYNDEVFKPEKRCDFEYKNGSKYSAVFGETVNIDGKTLRKIIVSEEENYLTEHAMDTAKLPQNYYIEDNEFDKVDKKDLAKYLSNLEYKNNEEELKIEEKGFVGKYIGGISIDKKGKIKNTNYDKSLLEKYGTEIHIQKENESLDMSEYVYDENNISQSYLQKDEDRNVHKSVEDKTLD